MMAETDFEAPLLELQQKIDALAQWPGDPEKEKEARDNVGRGQMGTATWQCRKIDRQHRGQRLALARLHLRDRTVEGGDTADQLHVIVSHPQRSLRSLAHQCERFWKQS